MRPSVPMTFAIVAAVVLASTTCRAQQAGTADLQKQVEALKAQVGSMQKDLDEIKALLAPLRRAAQPPRPEAISLELGSRPVRGSAAAKVVLAEFTDYQ